MRSTFLTLVPIAIVVGLSPIALVQMILVLLSQRARTNGPIFLGAVAVEVFLITFVSATLIGASAEDASDRAPVMGVVLLVGAAGLLVLAVRGFRARHDRKVPAILASIDAMGPKGVLLLSLGATLLNPKNLLLLLSAGSIVGEQGDAVSDVTKLVAGFTVVAIIPFAGMVAATLFGGDGMAARLDRWKEWLLDNNQLLMAGVLALLAVMLAAKGLDAF